MDENITMFMDINGQRHFLEVGQLYLFGKLLPPNDSHNNVFHIEHEDVDEKHCCVEVSSPEDVKLYDLFSSKGTYLNGKRLMPLTKLAVKSGDVIKLGQYQCLRFYNDEQLEVSHDSSGFGDNNKNTSDIIASSPETSAHRLKRVNNNNSDNFLVPAIPSNTTKSSVSAVTKSQSSRLSNSFVVPETEAVLSNSRRSSLGFNTSNNKSRNSDSFIIPETQYCSGGGRASLASNLSIAESTTSEGDKTRMEGNFNNSTGDDDFCIPETQEFVCSQRPRPFKEKMTTLEEKSVDLNDSDDEGINGINGSDSQIRICTQDYNDGFGEEDNSLMQSQVIPLIKHNTVLLNTTAANPPRQELSPDKEHTTEEDNEVANINSDVVENEVNPQINDDLNCSTPDLFDCQALEAIVNENNQAVTALMNDGVNIFENDPPTTSAAGGGMEDEEDYLATQMFPASSNSSNKSSNNAMVDKTDKKSKEKNIFDGNDDEALTLSDKENMQPDKLDPISDLPPTQLFASNGASSEHSSTSTSSSRKSNTHKIEDKQTKQVPIGVVKPSSNVSQKQIDEDVLAEPPADNVMGDDEDDILTQAFVPPPRITKCTTTSIGSSIKATNNCFNSTLLEDKNLDRNPAAFFAEVETSPKGLEKSISNTKAFKMPERNVSTVKKTSSAVSTASTESDMDLLMCTPQFIKEHIPFSKSDDLRKSILAVKNKNLFGDDDEDDDKEDSDKDVCLVQLINVPKNTNDFDKLLPHLKQGTDNEKKSQLTKEQKAALEARKEYKFNASFGEEQNSKKDGKTSSSTLSRDERHAARDREKEDKRKSHNGEKAKGSTRHKKKDEASSGISKKERENAIDNKKTTNEKDEKTSAEELPSTSKKTETKRSSRKTKDEKEENKPIAKRQTRSAQQDTASSKDEEITVVNQANSRPSRRNTRLQSSEMLVEKETKVPARRNTRLKSKETQSSKDSVMTTDDLDSVSTQPFIRHTRARTRSRSQQKDSNEAMEKSSNSSTSTVPRVNLNSSRTLNHSNSRMNTSSLNNIENNISAGRKRKSELTAPQQIDEKKRLKRVNSQDSTTSSATSTSLSVSPRPLISITMVDPERFEKLQSKSNGLWAVAKDPKESQILVMDKTFRTFKFLLAMARGIPIVTSQWLNDINTAKSIKKVPPLNKYLLNDPGFEKKHKFTLETSLQLARENKQGLFHGYEFVMTTNIKPTPAELKAIIEISGGIVHTKSPPPAKENQKIYLISCNDDRKDWHKFRRINKNITIITTEAIMSSIMRQNCTPLSNHVLV
ncbi:probable serine/threonine-protein kinase DDB_G0282963 [Musca vetustissima]|uniref:probable serine/threonine-protein kinase DDB_G0282963 n=1 Tax=Musca vetustissima TaxID=27455 RepID=UPI002AB6676E|nr:probable serine/threonine-protein kinase DDB_G0282963 [Musca vetustissima]